ncbi:PKD domain-containing protein, partial [Algoriphagus yeomjeoni]
MDTLSNCQLNAHPQASGFFARVARKFDFRIMLIFPLIFLLGFFNSSELIGQTAVVNPATPFNIDLNNPPSCPQNNLRIIAVDFRDPLTGLPFDPIELDGTPLGTPIDGDIFVTFAVSGQGYNFHVQYDLLINDVSQGQQGLCIVVEDGNGNTINITNGLQIKVADFTWNYGDKVEIKNVYQTWVTGNAKPNDKSCPSSAGNSQCDFQGEGFVVETPIVANFEFETFCDNRNVAFTNLSTGGDPEVVSTYLWDFGDGNTSTQINPTHTYAAAGTYDVTLTSSNSGISDEETFAVTVFDPIALTINSPPAVCLPGTVDLTAAFVTNGSSVGLTYTYWLDDQATQPLNNPDAVVVGGTYYIKGTNPITNCELIKPVVVTITPATAITTQPEGDTYCIDSEAAALTVAGSGTGTITYQWFSNEENSNTGGT